MAISNYFLSFPFPAHFPTAFNKALSVNDGNAPTFLSTPPLDRLTLAELLNELLLFVEWPDKTILLILDRDAEFAIRRMSLRRPYGQAEFVAEQLLSPDLLLDDKKIKRLATKFWFEITDKVFYRDSLAHRRIILLDGEARYAVTEFLFRMLLLPDDDDEVTDLLYALTLQTMALDMKRETLLYAPILDAAQNIFKYKPLAFGLAFRLPPSLKEIFGTFFQMEWRMLLSLVGKKREDSFVKVMEEAWISKGGGVSSFRQIRGHEYMQIKLIAIFSSLAAITIALLLPMLNGQSGDIMIVLLIMLFTVILIFWYGMVRAPGLASVREYEKKHPQR